jgi:hypothetical protein
MMSAPLLKHFIEQLADASSLCMMAGVAVLGSDEEKRHGGAETTSCSTRMSMILRTSAVVAVDEESTLLVGFLVEDGVRHRSHRGRAPGRRRGPPLM